MENTLHTKSKLDRGFDLFQEKLKSLLSFLNIFTVLTIVFFLCIFLPYATLTGNVADWVKDANKKQKNIPIESCEYNLKSIIAKTKELKDPRNNERFSEFETLNKRLSEFKTPFIDKIPISAREAMLYFPILISAFLLVLSLRFRDVVNTHEYLLSENDKQDEFGIKKYAQIPLLYIAFLGALISIVYLLSIGQLLARIYANNCNLLDILREQISYRQHSNWYNFFYGISVFLFFTSIVLIFRFARKYLKRTRSTESLQ